MNSKTLASIVGSVAILTGLGSMVFWRDYVARLFVPLVSGIHQNGSGKIVVTDINAPFTLWLLTSGMGLLITLVGAGILVFSLLKKNRTMR